MVQFMTASEQVEHAHRLRGEPTYRELKEQRDALLNALQRFQDAHIKTFHQDVRVGGEPVCELVAMSSAAIALATAES